MQHNIELLMIGFLIVAVLLFIPRTIKVEIIQDTLEANIEQETFIIPTPEEFLKHEIERAGLTDRDYLIMQEIIFCESSWKQYWSDGSVKVSKGNIGLAQINYEAHHDEYKQLGLDPYNPLQNLQYAVILYKRNGVQDWQKWSGHCWIPRLEKIGIIIE